MAQAEENIYNRLASAPTFHPVTADLFVDDWGLDAGDVVSVQSGGTTYSVPIYNLSLDWHGSTTAQIQSTGNRTRKPLPALKRRQYGGGRSSYREIKQTSVEYERHFIATDRLVQSTMEATGVLVDENGNPLIDPETGEYIFDTSGQGATLASRVQQTAGELATEVELRRNGEVELSSQITQTANQIRTEVTNHVSGLQSQITQTAEEIESEVSARQNGETQLRSTISQTASQIQLEVANEVDALDSRITQNADAIATEVTNRQNADTTIRSSITQNADKIALVVTSSGGNNTINAASIVTAVNGSGSSVVISADKINLEGYVQASYIDAEKAVVDELVSQTGYAGTIRASTISTSGNITAAGAVYGSGLYIGSSAPYTNVANAVRSFGTPTSSNGQISIPWTRLDGTSGTPITFNIADTAYYQDHVGIASTGSWAWDGDESNFVREITANDATTETIIMPTVVVYANTPSNPGQNFAAYARVSGDSHDISLAKSFYLQASGNYVYVTTNGSTPTPGTNVVAQLLNPSSGTGGIASVTDGGWTYTNNNYQNIVTATANDGTTGTATVILPTISCQVNTGTSSNATIRPYGPGNNIISTGTALTLYLKSDDNYVYLTNTNATPAVGTNVVARASNSAYTSGQTAAGVSINVNNKTVERALSSSTKAVEISAVPSYSYNSSTHRYTVFATAKAANTEMDSDNTTTGLEAYNAGWASAYGKVTLPGAMTTSSNNIVTVYTPPSAVDGTRVGTNFYLVCDDDYAYIRSVSTATGGTTYARIVNPKEGGGDIGIDTVSAYRNSDASADWTSWRSDFNNYTSVSGRYTYIRAVPNEGPAYNFGINAEGVYNAGRTSGLPTSLSTGGGNGYTATTDVGSITANMAGGGYVYTAGTGATGSDGVAYVIVKLTATNSAGEEVFTRYAYNKAGPTNVYKRGYVTGYNNAPVGLASGGNLVVYRTGEASNSEATYNGWTGHSDTIDMTTYKYKRYDVFAADGTSKIIRIHAEGVYDKGYEAGVASVGFGTDFVVNPTANRSDAVADLNSWKSAYSDGFTLGGHKYCAPYAKTTSGVQKNFWIDASATFTAGMNAVKATFTTASSLPSGKTATTFTAGTLWNFKIVEDGTTTTSVYYRVPSSSTPSASGIDLQVQSPTTTTMANYSGTYTSKVAMTTLTNYITNYSGMNTRYYIPVKATFSNGSGTKLYYITLPTKSELSGD